MGGEGGGDEGGLKRRGKSYRSTQTHLQVDPFALIGLNRVNPPHVCVLWPEGDTRFVLRRFKLNVRLPQFSPQCVARRVAKPPVVRQQKSHLVQLPHPRSEYLKAHL